MNRAKCYLTEYRKNNKKWGGPKVLAMNWKEAEKKAEIDSEEMGVKLKVIGELVEEIDINIIPGIDDRGGLNDENSRRT